MIWTIVVLFLVTLFGGLMVLPFEGRKLNLSFPLVFAGSYLFSITIIHIIPELFSFHTDEFRIGIFILLGFFLQQILEYFSKGIEHGHVHANQAQHGFSRYSVVSALVVHSLLEGALLTHESPFHQQHESYTLLFGILLHKVPAALALMLTMHQAKYRWGILVVFAMASPIGLVLSHVFLISGMSLLVIFAMVCGSFLHISTTIFVETSPEHRFGFKKLFISLWGAALGVLGEWLT